MEDTIPDVDEYKDFPEREQWMRKFLDYDILDPVWFQVLRNHPELQLDSTGHQVALERNHNLRNHIYPDAYDALPKPPTCIGSFDSIAYSITSVTDSLHFYHARDMSKVFEFPLRATNPSTPIGLPPSTIYPGTFFTLKASATLPVMMTKPFTNLLTSTTTAGSAATMAAASSNMDIANQLLPRHRMILLGYDHFVEAIPNDVIAGMIKKLKKDAPMPELTPKINTRARIMVIDVYTDTISMRCMNSVDINNPHIINNNSSVSSMQPTIHCEKVHDYYLDNITLDYTQLVQSATVSSNSSEGGRGLTVLANDPWIYYLQYHLSIDLAEDLRMMSMVINPMPPPNSVAAVPPAAAHEKGGHGAAAATSATAAVSQEATCQVYDLAAYKEEVDKLQILAIDGEVESMEPLPLPTLVSQWKITAPPIPPAAAPSAAAASNTAPTATGGHGHAAGGGHTGGNNASHNSSAATLQSAHPAPVPLPVVDPAEQLALIIVPRILVITPPPSQAIATVDNRANDYYPLVKLVVILPPSLPIVSILRLMTKPSPPPVDPATLKGAGAAAKAKDVAAAIPAITYPCIVQEEKRWLLTSGVTAYTMLADPLLAYQTVTAQKEDYSSAWNQLSNAVILAAAAAKAVTPSTLTHRQQTLNNDITAAPAASATTATALVNMIIPTTALLSSTVSASANPYPRTRDLLAIGQLDGSITLWQIASHTLVGTLGSHPAIATSSSAAAISKTCAITSLVGTTKATTGVVTLIAGGIDGTVSMYSNKQTIMQHLLAAQQSQQMQLQTQQQQQITLEKTILSLAIHPPRLVDFRHDLCKQAVLVMYLLPHSSSSSSSSSTAAANSDGYLFIHYASGMQAWYQLAASSGGGSGSAASASSSSSGITLLASVGKEERVHFVTSYTTDYSLMNIPHDSYALAMEIISPPIPPELIPPPPAAKPAPAGKAGATAVAVEELPLVEEKVEEVEPPLPPPPFTIQLYSYSMEDILAMVKKGYTTSLLVTTMMTAATSSGKMLLASVKDHQSVLASLSSNIGTTVSAGMAAATPTVGTMTAATPSGRSLYTAKPPPALNATGGGKNNGNATSMLLLSPIREEATSAASSPKHAAGASGNKDRGGGFFGANATAPAAMMLSSAVSSSSKMSKMKGIPIPTTINTSNTLAAQAEDPSSSAPPGTGHGATVAGVVSTYHSVRLTEQRLHAHELSYHQQQSRGGGSQHPDHHAASLNEMQYLLQANQVAYQSQTLQPKDVMKEDLWKFKKMRAQQKQSFTKKMTALISLSGNP